MRVDGDVPRPQLADAHFLLAPLEDSRRGRAHRLLDGFMEPHAVVGRVVEAILLAVDEVAIVLESCVVSDLLARGQHLVEDAGQHAAPFEVRLRAQLEGPLANRPVG